MEEVKTLETKESIAFTNVDAGFRGVFTISEYKQSKRDLTQADRAQIAQWMRETADSVEKKGFIGYRNAQEFTLLREVQLKTGSFTYKPGITTWEQIGYIYLRSILLRLRRKFFAKKYEI